MKSSPKAAAIYARISSDRAGLGLGVERQERLCRELAERKGWPVTKVYVDNDLSAYGGAPRPAYEALCRDIQDDNVDAVLCVDLDRLTRRPVELETFIDLADRHGIALANASGDTDLSTSDGRFRARIMGAVARQESEKKSERIRREREQLALSGKPTPGPRPFGYEAGGLDVRDGEADLIRAAAARILAGEPMRSVADRWNQQGIKTARGNDWSVNSLRAVLTGPRIAGLRRHQGAVIGDAIWPAIIDRATHDELVALATRRKRPGRAPKLLLTGILVCGREGCGEVLRSAVHRNVRVYKCRRSPGEHRGCQRLSIKADRVDAFVADAVIHRLSGPALDQLATEATTGTSTTDLSARIQADERALEDLVDAFYVDRSIPQPAFTKAKRRLDERLAQHRAQLDSQAGGSVLSTLPRGGDALRRKWEHPDTTNDWRRAVIMAVLQEIIVKPYSPTSPRVFDPSRLDPKWRA